MKKGSKKIEFSKVLTLVAVIILMLVAIWSIINYYTLTKLAIETGASILPDSAIPIACITTILGAILSYCLYQGLLKNSLNKNKLMIDENGIIKPIFDNLVDDLCDKIINDKEDYPEQDIIACDKE